MVPDAEWSGVRDGASGLEMLQECVFCVFQEILCGILELLFSFLNTQLIFFQLGVSSGGRNKASNQAYSGSQHIHNNNCTYRHTHTDVFFCASGGGLLFLPHKMGVQFSVVPTIWSFLFNPYCQRFGWWAPRVAV